MTRRGCLLTAVVVLAAFVPAAARQAVDPGAIFRVFLKSGQALPSYGESALVGDRVVFTLLLGTAPARTALQLTSLPVTTVDVDRTRRYANTIRAKHYAATRGEVDFAAMSQEVQRTLAQLGTVQEPKRRLQLAEEAKKKLMSWAESTYGYRAGDVRVLTGMFDEVIAELRAAAGERQFAVDLRVGQSDFDPEPLLDPPTLRESITLALAAAGAVDTEEDRLAILDSAASLATDPSMGDLSAAIGKALEREAIATALYTAMVSEVRGQAEAARKKGDVAGIEAAIQALRAHDKQFGRRRDAIVSAAESELDEMLVATRAYREKLDHYALVRGSLLAYERTMRPMMSGFDGLSPVFSALRDGKFTAYERLEVATTRLESFRSGLKTVQTPPDLVDVHASFESALQMADYAVARRKLAVSTTNEAYDREASAAAAGAIMLASLAREQLVARLYPPKIQ
jgi:hypothetical protein